VIAKKSHWCSNTLFQGLYFEAVWGFGLQPSNKNAFCFKSWSSGEGITIQLRTIAFEALALLLARIPRISLFGIMPAWQDLREKDSVFFLEASEVTFLVAMSSLRKKVFNFGGRDKRLRWSHLAHQNLRLQNYEQIEFVFEYQRIWLQISIFVAK